MRVLDRYIVLATGRYIALTMAVLLVLLAVFLFVNEQGWAGAGEYGQLQALRYVLMQLPSAALQFLPMAALIGALLAVGQLARGSEITVMRAAGVSMARVAGSVAIAGLLLLPPALAAGEWFAPSLAQAARASRTLLRGEGPGLAQDAAWMREGRLLLRAGAHGGVTVFELGPDGRLAAVSTARQSRQPGGEGWELRDMSGTRFGAAGAAHASGGIRRLGADAQLQLARQDPRQQSLASLAAEIRRLEQQGHDARRERFAFWGGIARLVAIPLAMLLAVPLVPGFLRRAEGGARATLGLALGMVYFMVQRVVENGALAFTLDPLLLAWVPTLLLGAAVALLLWRMQRVSVA